MTTLYSPDRVSKISEIMPKFSQHVEVGDAIHLGLEGDPHFPPSFRGSRPTGTVTSVNRTIDGATDLKVHLEDGRKVKLNGNSIDPRHLWEFTDDTFETVLSRAHHQREANFRSTAIIPSNSGSMDPKLDQLQRELDDMRLRLESEIQESRAFNNTVIASMNEIAADVCAANPNAEFCSVLHKEYSRLNSNNALQSHTQPTSNVNMFESDYESSDDDL